MNNMAENLEQLDEMNQEKKESKKEARAREKAEKKLKKAEKKADKNKTDFDLEEDKSGSKIAIVFTVIGIILIWIAILAALIKFDVGGFGSEVLKPVLKDIPYINKILPGSELEDKILKNPEYPYKTLEEAIEQIKQLQLELQEAQETSQTETDTNEELQAEIERLKSFEESQVEFQNLKAEFYEEVVFGENTPDISEYKKYYESIDPTNAELLYKQVVEQVSYDKEVEDYARTYSAMKPKQAAAILEKLSDNLKLVAQILQAMDTESRAGILGAMDAEFAAKITKIMAPEE